jgi:hypothetical protein
MAIFKTFKFWANTIDGQIQSCPVLFHLECDKVKPIQYDVVRMFDGNECIMAIKVYLVYYCGQLLGSTMFKTLDDFLAYRNSNCGASVNECNLMWNGCALMEGNCVLKYTN